MDKLPGLFLAGKCLQHLMVIRIDRDPWRTDIAQPDPILPTARWFYPNIRNNVPVLVIGKLRTRIRIQPTYPGGRLLNLRYTGSERIRDSLQPVGCQIRQMMLRHCNGKLILRAGAPEL
ncbi:hypothetical protein D3C81_1837870 [compost metagenome]